MFLSCNNQSGARRGLPRGKDPDLAADPQGENAHAYSQLGQGLVGIAILFHPKVRHHQVHMDVHVMTLPQSGQDG